MTIITYGSQDWNPNQIHVQIYERLQMRATKWILEKDCCYFFRLKELELLPLCLYIKMLDLLMFISKFKGNFTAKTECLSELCDNTTRQQTRGDFEIEKKTVTIIR